MKHWIAALSLLTLNTFAVADQLELGLSDKEIEGNYESFYSNNFSTQISLMHSDVDSVDNTDAHFQPNPTFPLINNTEDNVQTDMLGFGVFANGKQGNIRTHLGGKVFYLSTEHSNKMHGLALGGGLDAYIRPNFFISGQVLYAPDIVTGGDFNNYYEFNTRANFQIIQNASLFVGFKDMAADFDKRKLLLIGGGTANREFFKGFYVGFRFNI